MSLPEDAHVGRVGLAVADPDAVADWYAAVAGLERLPGDESATLGAGGDPLLSLRPARDLPPRPADAAGLFHLALRYPDRPALAAALDRVRTHADLDGASDHLVSEALYLADPAANGVELYRDRPRAEWTRHPDGGVEIDTLPLDLDDLASALDGAPPAAAPPGTDVGHVHLEVTDLDAARAFYVDALGFDVTARYDGALFVAAGGYHHHLGLNVWNRRSAPAAGQGLDWFEVVLPDDAAVDAAVERLRAAGHAPARTADGATVADPDGIELRLVPE